MKKFITLNLKPIKLTSLLLASLFITGCSNNVETETTIETPYYQNDLSGQKRVFTDHMGREVIIEGDITRPIALTPNFMEGLFTLGVAPVATLENYSIREEANLLPSLGLPSDINIEKIYATNPDFIVGHIRNHAHLIETLEAVGVPVVIYDPAQVENFTIYSSVEFLGEVLGKQEEAALHIENVRSLADELSAEIDNNTNFKTAIIIQDGEAIVAAQPRSSFGSVLHLLGLTNIVPEDMPGSNQDTFVPFSIESILYGDPDIILIAPLSNDKEQNQIRLEQYKSDPAWQNLTAVKNGNIKMLPFEMVTGHATAEQMLEMGANTILS